jgi:hypothetical protein
MFDLCTTGDTAHIDTIFKFLSHVNMCAPIFFTAAMIRAFRSAVKNIGAPVLARVWQEHEYSIDVCRVTRSAYIEHL